jgi:hypothetical protein
MKSISYQFNPNDIKDDNYAALFEERRRDALFAYARKEPDGSMLLIRDHLGAMPLFYRALGGAITASRTLSDLLKKHDTLSEEGLRSYLGTGTVKTVSLFKEVHIVPPGTALRVFPNGKTETLYTYRIEPRELPEWSLTDCILEADRLLLQAAKRVVKKKTVGLYLSGGIDSALSGLYLSRAGASIRAYTATPWGAESQEAKLAALNAKTIGALSHEMRPMATNRYATYSAEALKRYGNPCGATSQMAILCLLQETEAGNEEQIVFAQNCDTMNTSVPDQSLLYFLSMVPRELRGMLHASLGAKSIMDELVSFRTTGLLRTYAPLTPYERGYSTLTKLGIAGMFYAHSPVDGDLVVLPSMNAGQIVSNLFYDMDVIEFALGIPLLFRLEWSKESKFGIAITKKVFKELARQTLPDEIVNRKKGFAVPVSRDDQSKEFFTMLPTKLGDHALKTPVQRFSAEILRRFSLLEGAPAALSDLFPSHE